MAMLGESKTDEELYRVCLLQCFFFFLSFNQLVKMDLLQGSWALSKSWVRPGPRASGRGEPRPAAGSPLPVQGSFL